MLLFYNQRLYVGLGYSDRNFIMHSYGIERPGAKLAGTYPPNAETRAAYEVWRKERNL